MARRKSKGGRRSPLKVAKTTLAFTRKAIKFASLEPSGISPLKLFKTLKRRPKKQTQKRRTGPNKQTNKQKTVRRIGDNLHSIESVQNLIKTCRLRQDRQGVLHAKRKTGSNTAKNVRYKPRSEITCR